MTGPESYIYAAEKSVKNQDVKVICRNTEHESYH